MKKLLILLLTLNFLGISCENRNTNKDNVKVEYRKSDSIRITYKQIDKNISDNDNNEFKVFISYPELQPESNVNKLINNKVVDFTFNDFEEEFLDSGNIESQIEDFALSYLMSYDEVPTADRELTHESIIDTSYLSEQIIFFEKQLSTYYGGAHGMQGDYYLIIDFKTGEELGVSDIFSDTLGIRDLAEDYFLKEQGLQRTSEAIKKGFMFEGGFQITDNFTFSDDKIIFVYNPYEIGPYSMGVIKVKIPLIAAKHLIRDKYKPDNIN